jgi:hypothetical protein
MVQEPILSQEGNVSVTKMKQIYGFHGRKRAQFEVMGIYVRDGCVRTNADSDIRFAVDQVKSCSFNFYVPLSNVEDREDCDQQNQQPEGTIWKQRFDR